MNIVVVCDDYPFGERSAFVFVKHLVDELVLQGNSITVMAPQSATKFIFTKRKRLPIASSYDIRGNRVFVKRPYFLSFSNAPLLSSLARGMRRFILDMSIRNLDEKVDLIYCHFWENAFAVAGTAYRMKIPIVVASGESKIPALNYVSKQAKTDLRKALIGCVCVSTKNMVESERIGLLQKDDYIILPNAVNLEHFYPRNKEIVRKKLGWSLDDIIVIFVGAFVERKGVERLSRALSELKNEKVKAVFVGKGDQEPSYEQTIFSGTVRNEDLPHYLSAADIFVLPTLAEGCSNAIVEALACAVPVISSNMDFNFDILDEKVSLCVDPVDIISLSCAIEELALNEERRSEMSKEALLNRAKYDIRVRANLIMEFISTRIT